MDTQNGHVVEVSEDEMRAIRGKEYVRMSQPRLEETMNVHQRQTLLYALKSGDHELVCSFKQRFGIAAVVQCMDYEREQTSPRFNETVPSAVGMLKLASDAIGERAASRDMPHGERSMKRAVASFNALTGATLSERDGWLFMVVLKAARATAGKTNADDFIDGAAYMALAGECAVRA